MKPVWLFFLFLLAGCLGSEPPQMDNHETTAELNLSKIVLDRADLEHGWTPSFQNISEDVYEKRFVRVEAQFGELSRIKNIVHLYPDPGTALKDFQNASSQLEESIPFSKPDVGDNSIMWKQSSEAYILFIRKNVVVELKFTGSVVEEGEKLVDIAKKIDMRI